MIIMCNRIISPATKEDMDKSPWLIKGNKYVVLGLTWSSLFGLEACILTEQDNDIGFINLNGFEFVSQKTPSSWVTKISKCGDSEEIISMYPASWEYDSFFEDLDDEDPKAIKLYRKEVQNIYREEGLIN